MGHIEGVGLLGDEYGTVKQKIPLMYQSMKSKQDLGRGCKMAFKDVSREQSQAVGSLLAVALRPQVH